MSRASTNAKTAVRKAEADLGPVEVIVNNAGITRDGTMKKMARTGWDDVLDTNLGGCFNMCKAAWDGMLSRGFGRVVNIGSINGQAGQYGQVNYAAAKSGIHGFTKALAQEGAPKGITVNARSRPDTSTPTCRPAAVPAEVLEKIKSRIPWADWGRRAKSPAASSSSSPTMRASSPAPPCRSTAGKHMYLTDQLLAPA